MCVLSCCYVLRFACICFPHLAPFRGRNFQTPRECASVCSFHFSLHSFLVFNGRVSVTDEVGQSPGFPYFLIAVRFRRLSPVEPINLTDVFSVRRYAARRPSPLILSVFNWPFPVRAGPDELCTCTQRTGLLLT